MKSRKVLAIILFTISVMGFCSCSSATEKCVKSKQKMIQQMRGEDYPRDVNEAITKYDFEVARIYLGCYPVEENRNSFTDNLVEESRSAVNERITRAEISYLIMNCTPPEISKARALASENDLQEVFNKVYNNYLYKQVDQHNYTEAIDLLYTFDMPSVAEKYDFERAYSTEYYFSASWGPEAKIKKSAYFCEDVYNYYAYDCEAKRVNGLIDIILTAAIRTGDVELARECVQSYKPSVDVSNYKRAKDDYHIYTLKLVDKPKQEAQKKLKAAGINL
ncbi:MAG: hypothetical protein II899_10310 [Bacteroidales bacterium]|nr:hypothetical protein [Bacteroidales bacterium]